MTPKIQDPKDFEDDILEEGQESVGDIGDEELNGSNGSTESDSSTARAEPSSAELSCRLLLTSTNPFRRPT